MGTMGTPQQYLYPMGTPCQYLYMMGTPWDTHGIPRFYNKTPWESMIGIHPMGSMNPWQPMGIPWETHGKPMGHFCKRYN